MFLLLSNDISTTFSTDLVYLLTYILYTFLAHDNISLSSLRRADFVVVEAVCFDYSRTEYIASNL